MVSGPAAPVISRIRNMYLLEILLKLKQDAVQLSNQKRIILNDIDLMKANKNLRSVIVVCDVDPY
jgi:primosomal protein N' (replication factor Y)